MNDFKISNLLDLVDSNTSMFPIDDLRLARELIARNHKLLSDYIRLEDALNYIDDIIKSHKTS